MFGACVLCSFRCVFPSSFMHSLYVRLRDSMVFSGHTGTLIDLDTKTKEEKNKNNNNNNKSYVHAHFMWICQQYLSLLLKFFFSRGSESGQIKSNVCITLNLKKKKITVTVE